MAAQAKLERAEERLRRVLSGDYQSARTRGDVLAAALLMHRGIESAVEAHVAAPNPAGLEFPAKLDALPPGGAVAGLRGELWRLHEMRRELAHPTHVNHQFVLDTAAAFVRFLRDNWAALLRSAAPPPNPRPPVIPFRYGTPPHLVGIPRRLRSILTTEYRLAHTRGDALEAVLLLHKGIEDFMESVIPAAADGRRSFAEKAVLVFPHDRREELLILHHLRTSYAHPVYLDAAQVADTADRLARFVAGNWGLMGDGAPLHLTPPVISGTAAAMGQPARAAAPAPARAVPVRAAPVRAAPVRAAPVRATPVRATPVRATPPVAPAAAPRRRFDWAALAVMLLCGGLAVGLAVFAHVYRATLPERPWWPLLVGMVVAIPLLCAALAAGWRLVAGE